jgi:hypothetical protein
VAVEDCAPVESLCFVVRCAPDDALFLGTQDMEAKITAVRMENTVALIPVSGRAAIFLISTVSSVADYGRFFGFHGLAAILVPRALGLKIQQFQYFAVPFQIRPGTALDELSNFVTSRR